MLNATPFLRLYARYRLARLAALNPAVAQQQELIKLVRHARTTRFGREHHFDSIRSVEQYQQQVPLRSYEQFWEQYWKDSFPHFKGVTWPDPIHFIPVSSGTSSGTTKWFPCSSATIRSNTRGALEALVHHLEHNPRSNLFSGKNFVLGGSADLVERAPGIFSGDLSGIVVKTLPWWAKSRYFPPPDMALIKNWEEKIDTMARASLQQRITLLSGVPAWMLILFDKLNELCPNAAGRISGIYPHLELIIHGGVNFAPYLERFRKLLEGSRAELREVYPASEGFIAVADRGYGEGLRLLLDNGIFFEFVPLAELGRPSPTRHWIGNVEQDVNYAVVMTTCSGLWSYIIGDTVRFVDRAPHRVLITGRTSYYLSAFGEHLIAEEIEDGVSHGASQLRRHISDYSVGALFPENTGELGRHLYVVEFAGQTPSAEELRQFRDELDKRLCQRNEDYEAHRSGDFGLHPPAIVAVAPGTFTQWMKSRGKLGGQNKVPRIITDSELFKGLRDFAQRLTVNSLT